MRIENIKRMNIQDCMDRLFLRYETLKEIVSNNNTQESIQNAICQSLMDTSETTMAIVQRLTELLLHDKQAFMACQSLNDYQEYVSQSNDGLWKEDAEEMARKKEQQMKDTAFFNKKKDSIKGLQTYLKKYPNGIHTRTANELLQKKTKFAKICIIFLGLIVLAAIFYKLVFADPSDLHAIHYNNLHSVIYDVTGGEEKVAINNDSNKGLSVNCDQDWFTASVNSKKEITISCGQNDYEPQKGKVTVRCGGKSCEIIVNQQGWVDCKECDNGWIKCKRCGGDGVVIDYVDYLHNVNHTSPCSNCTNGLVKCNKCSIDKGGDGKGRVKSYNTTYDYK